MKIPVELFYLLDKNVQLPSDDDQFPPTNNMLYYSWEANIFITINNSRDGVVKIFKPTYLPKDLNKKDAEDIRKVNNLSPCDEIDMYHIFIYGMYREIDLS